MTMTRNSNFAERLGIIYKEMDCSYSELGKILGMQPQTLNRYVLGERVPKIDDANEIAHKLDINPLWLQGYDVNKENPADITIDGMDYKDIFNSLSVAQQKEALRYAHYLLSQEGKQ